MNDITVYENKNFGNLRVLEMDGLTWFVAADVLSVLQMTHPERTLSRWVDEEDRMYYNLQESSYKGGRGNPNVALVNESGFYSLVFASKQPFAREFKRWVTSEVLPSIRQHGYYISKDAKDRAEAIELVLSGYDELRPEKAKILKREFIQGLKDQNKVLTSENRQLKRSLRISEDRASDLEHQLKTVQSELLEQAIKCEPCELDD